MCASLLLVRSILTSKSSAQAIFHICALLLLVRQNLTSKSSAHAFLHVCITFAGSFDFNQQK